MHPAPTEVQAWRAAFEEGRRAHPRLELPYARFRGVVPAAQAPRAAEDYFLARACDAGLPGGWERLQLRYRRRLRAFLRRRGARAQEADQLLDETWGALASPPPRGGARTRIGTYDGRGALHAWLCTVLWRRLADRWRARSGARETAVETHDAVAQRVDPALSVSQQETLRRLARSLEEAWAGLTPRELQAVVLKYRHHLPQKEIARRMRVGAPRVTRMLQSATERLRKAIRDRFDRHTDWEVGGGGWDSLLATVESMLTRTAADVEDAAPGRTVDG